MRAWAARKVSRIQFVMVVLERGSVKFRPEASGT